MPITELAMLHLKPGCILGEIAPLLKSAGGRQEAVSGYPVHFFIADVKKSQEVIRPFGNEDEGAVTSQPKPNTSIFIVAGWASVAAHEEWIASETNQNILIELKDIIGVDGLRHLNIDPRGFPGEDSRGLEILVFELPEGSRKDSDKNKLTSYFEYNVKDKGGITSRQGWNVESNLYEYVLLRSLGDKGMQQTTTFEDASYLPTFQAFLHKL